MGARLSAVLIALSALLLGLAGTARAGEVGFRQVAIPNGADAPLQVGIWYPTLTPGSPQRLELFTQDVAPDAPVFGHDLPLIVISHGNGGSLAGHYDTAIALARAGFVVAAPTHTGDNWRDQSRAVYTADRPRHIHAVIDYMLGGWPERVSLDPARIGVFGFSSGGFTMLVAAGGEPDLAKVRPYCASHATTYVCSLIRRAAPATLSADAPAPAPPVWVHDARIKAAVIAAPALGFTFAPDGLKGVTLPVQLWRAEADRVLPAPDYAEPVRDALPRPADYHVVPGADHWDFLAPCSPALTQAAPPICGEIAGFDRAAFHQTFNAAVVAFFQRALK
jgi:predicted dienelactone hydrolase